MTFDAGKLADVCAGLRALAAMDEAAAPICVVIEEGEDDVK